MPADEIRDHLPSAMGANAWRTFAKLKEQWGVSMQALLFRARQLGRLSDVSYRNAMTTISARGWRREEPGLVGTIEQPSLLPRALELLVQEGIDENLIIEQCRVPPDLFRTVASRRPDILQESVRVEQRNSNNQQSGGRVISLLDRVRQ
jgi:Zn-dependent peptidase ImmA (M78 family)